MADGEATYDRFYLIRNDPFPSTPVIDVPQTKECCADDAILALADTVNLDPLRNDINGPIWCLPTIATGATLTLMKEGVDVVNLTTGQLLPSGGPVVMGTLLDYGDFINSDNRALVGYKLEWRNVLAQFGPGMYKVRIDITTAIAGISGTYYWLDFCLWPYSAARAEGTVYLEYYLNGVLGKANDDLERIDYGALNWYSGLRLPGWFGFFNPKYERTNVEYNTGLRQYVTLENEPEFELQLKPVKHFIHEIMSVDVMESDTLLITDYNSLNEKNYVRKRVNGLSYEIDRTGKMQSKLAPASAKFNQSYNNLRKTRQ